MTHCDFCEKVHHERILRSFMPNCADGDPVPEKPGGRVYICPKCESKRTRFIKLLEANRKNYAKLKGVT